MIKKALIAAAALLAFSAHAGYAQLANPEGFAGSAGKWTYAANAANDKVYGKVIHQAGGLTAQVAGQAVKMPAAYRLAANAPRIAAAVIFANPYVRVGVGIATWLGVAGVVWNAVTQKWEVPVGGDPGTGTLYQLKGGPPQEIWYTSMDQACQAYLAYVSPIVPPYWGSPGSNSITQCSVDKVVITKNWNGQTDRFTASMRTKPSGCPAGWYVTPAGCVQTAPLQPLTEEEFIDRVAPAPMPETVPFELPKGTPLPVDQPYINPAPGTEPKSQPYRVPTGQPSPVPNTDPQQWKQPYVDIVPAPTSDNPFRVDVKPGETVSTDPNPVENPNPDSQDKPTEEQDKSLCEKHPEIAACEKVEVTDKPLPDQPKLYEPKYPDGITGLWNSKIQEIKATPLFNLAPSLLPNVSAGSCPSWKIDLSIDGWTNAGLQDVSPPCWVWDVAKLVIIASALLLARRLIFGG